MIAWGSQQIVTDGLVLHLDAANNKSLDTRNLLYNTDSLTGWATAPYGSVISITPNFTLAPDGTFTASKFQFTQGLAYRCIMRNALLKLGETNTFSVYAKAVSGTATFTLDIGDQGWKNFTVNDTEWVRCSITHTRTSLFGGTTNFADITANLGTEVYLWGAQLNYGDLINYVPVGNTQMPFMDISGNRNNGTLINGPTFDSGNGGSIIFDGVNDYGNINIPIGTSDFSFNIWIKRISSATGVFFVLGRYVDTSFRGSMFYILNNTLRFRIGAATSNYADVPINTPVTGTDWVNICAVANRTSNAILYRNGIYDNQISISTQQGSVPNLTSIASIGGTQWSLNANLSNIQVYNRALTQQEVLQNYNATKSRFGL